MDGRTGFALGGFVVGVAVVAVASAATLSSAVALADAPGTAVGVDIVRVTPRTPASAAPAPSASASVVAPEIPSPAPTAEIVPAPAPLDVAAQSSSGGSRASSAPVADDLDASKREVEEEALRTGSWDRLRAWAAAKGWSTDRVDQWIGTLEAGNAREQATSQSSERTKTPANAGDDAGKSSGSKRAQSPQPPRGD